jgi:hypothetical protein
MTARTVRHVIVDTAGYETPSSEYIYNRTAEVPRVACRSPFACYPTCSGLHWTAAISGKGV